MFRRLHIGMGRLYDDLLRSGVAHLMSTYLRQAAYGPVCIGRQAIDVAVPSNLYGHIHVNLSDDYFCINISVKGSFFNFLNSSIS